MLDDDESEADLVWAGGVFTEARLSHDRHSCVVRDSLQLLGKVPINKKAIRYDGRPHAMTHLRRHDMLLSQSSLTSLHTFVQSPNGEESLNK